jgi:uncharacterized membrane protein YccC
MRRALIALRARVPTDPGFAALRRAARITLLMPAAFGASIAFHADAQFSTFLAFGFFALLVMGDFGGLRRPRAAAYAATTAVGAVLIAVGTLASATPWSAAIVALLICFVIRFCAVFGSYAAAAQSALLLSFVLAVALPGPPESIPTRLAGWLTAGALSMLGGIVLWPRFEKVALLYEAAAACRTLAQLITAGRDSRTPADIGDTARAATAAVGAARHDYATTPTRPAGPARRDRALVELLTELGSILEFATRPFNHEPSTHRLSLPGDHPSIEEGHRLAAAVAQTLCASADVLTGGGAAPDLAVLEHARLDHRRALDRWAGEALRSGTPPEQVLEGLDVDSALNVISYLTEALGSNAVLAAGGAPPVRTPLSAGSPLRAGPVAAIVRIVQTVRTHLSPNSAVLHDSMRVGIGLALAVLVGRLLQLDHAFWVVLGTLSVLRSNALATGRTTRQALAGTLAGFAIGAPYAQLASADVTLSWFILPLATFLTAYAWGAVGFVVSQAVFTIYVIVLFGLIAPAGWQLGLVRLEDVAIGAAISIVVALLLWPRGARRDLADAVAGLFRADAVGLGRAFERLLARGSPDSVSEARAVAERARARAEDALDQFLSERGPKRPDPQRAAFLVASGSHMILFSDLIDALPEMGYQSSGDVDGRDTLSEQIRIVLEALRRQADRLDASTHANGPMAKVSATAVREVSLSWLGRWRDEPDFEHRAIALVAVAEWVELLDELLVQLDEPVAEVVAASAVPWWR